MQLVDGLNLLICAWCAYTECLNRVKKNKQKRTNEKKGLLVAPPMFNHDRKRPFFERGSSNRRVRCKYCQVEIHNFLCISYTYIYVYIQGIHQYWTLFTLQNSQDI